MHLSWLCEFKSVKSTELKGQVASHQVAVEASEEGWDVERAVCPEQREQGCSLSPFPPCSARSSEDQPQPPKPASARWSGQPIHESVLSWWHSNTSQEPHVGFQGLRASLPLTWAPTHGSCQPSAGSVSRGRAVGVQGSSMFQNIPESACLCPGLGPSPALSTE